MQNSRKRWIRPVVAAALALVACSPGDNTIAAGEFTAASALGASTFEILDGDLVTNGGLDWVNAPNFAAGIDTPSGNEDNAFGQGSKEDVEPPTVVLGSVPPQKSDLSRFYMAHEQINGTYYLYLAWERFNVLGTANIDFEFSRSSRLSSNGVTTRRTPGDLLITFDLNNGGSRPELGVLRWVTAANGTAANCFSNNALPCWGFRQNLTAAGYAEGSVNTTTVVDPIAEPDIVMAGDRGPRFGEAAVNLTASGILDPTRCVRFGAARVNSRSSSSFTAELKDFIGPVPVGLNNCGDVTLEILKVDQDGVPLKGAVMQVYQDDGNGVLDATDTPLSKYCTTGPEGKCTFTATDEGTYIVHEEAAPEGYDVAPDQKVDIVLDFDPQTHTFTFTDYPRVGAINIQKTDDAGRPLAGAEFTLYRDNPATFGAPGAEDTTGNGEASCVTDKMGQCSFTSVGQGEWWVVETGVPPGYGPAGSLHGHATIARWQAGAYPTVDLEFVNRRIPGTIHIHKTDDANRPLAGAEFTLFPDQPALGISPDSGDLAASNPPRCVTDKLGQCSLLNVALGDYWVVETVTPAGHYSAYPDFAHVNMGLGAAPGVGEIRNLDFVNWRVPGSILVTRLDAFGRRVAGVTFTLFPDLPEFGGEPDPADTAGSGQPSCVTDKLGQCEFWNVPLGQYWMMETFTPPGLDAPSPLHQHAEIGLGSVPDMGQSVELTF